MGPMDVSIMGPRKGLTAGRVDEQLEVQSQEGVSSGFSSIISELCDPGQAV